MRLRLETRWIAMLRTCSFMLGRSTIMTEATFADAPLTMRQFADGDQATSDRILRSLPDWFGIEDAIVEYVKQSAEYPTWFACTRGQPIGIITLRQHFSQAAEIHLMAVLSQYHRRGVGRTMVEFAEIYLLERGVSFLQVKTQGPSRPDPNYALTQKFYEAMGFVSLEEFPDLWPGNPALQLVKRL
ncbi:MAG: GNAT family N-acetyltransferase, partial [Wenzhouxiangella sp.]